MSLDDFSLTLDEIRILGILSKIEQKPKDSETNQTIINENLKVYSNSDGIITVGKMQFKGQTNNWSIALNSLVMKNLVIVIDGIYTFTEVGQKLGKEVYSIWLSEFYDDLLIRSAESKAHAIFCERVFGKNLYQFNVLDMIQLEVMMDKLNLNTDDYVLDLGCGLGKVSEYISDISGAKILGIDFSKKAIEWVQKETEDKRSKLEYRVMDINKLDFGPETFNAIIAIDTLYFVDNLDSTINKLKKILKSNGQLALFWGQQRKPDDPIEILNPDGTKLATALRKSNLKFDAIDFTEVSRKFWTREYNAANDLKEMFEKEGNLDLCDWRIEDSQQTMSRIDNKLQKRYFYHVKK